MPFILTSNAVVTCGHGGRVTLIPRQQVVSISGGFVMCLADLVGAPVVGCPQNGPGIKPCTTLLAANPGSAAPNVLVNGQPVLLETFTAATDGAPPGVATVTSPGQTKVQA